jgi:hypothetical protein
VDSYEYLLWLAEDKSTNVGNQVIVVSILYLVNAVGIWYIQRREGKNPEKDRVILNSAGPTSALDLESNAEKNEKTRVSKAVIWIRMYLQIRV